MFRRNVDLGKALPISSWRKIAIGTWRTVGDPSVYAMLDLDATHALRYIENLKQKTGKRITVTHFVGKAIATVFKQHPQVNCILRFGKLYPRKSIDIFFQVANDAEGSDLSGMTIRNMDQKTIPAIAEEMDTGIHAIRHKGDPSFRKMKNTMGLIPNLFITWVIDAVGFIMYSLNLWSPLMGSPRDPFGSAMITNIGSLGLDCAFAPLVPYSRVPALFVVGAVRDTPIAVDGRVEIRPMLRICATFDHRLIDGLHGSHMAQDVQKIFAAPDTHLR